MSTFTRILVLLAVVATSQVRADFLGIYLYGNNWTPDISGNIESLSDPIDLEDTLGFSDDTYKQLGVRFEHPLPVLPNIAIQDNTLDTLSMATLNQSITYDGVVYLVDTDVTTTLDLSHRDIILYYEVLDNWISLDLGVNVMDFDGEFTLVSGGPSSVQTSNTVLDDMIPSLYSKVGFEFPATDIYVGGTISYIGLDGDSFTKTNVHLGWETDTGFGLEVGYQAFEAEWEDYNDSDGNIDLDGYYASLFFHF